MFSRRRKSMKLGPSTIMLAIVLCSVPLPAQSPQSPSQPDARPIPQDIGTRELELLKALRNGNSEVFSELTAEDAIFIDSRGQTTRKDAIKNAHNVTLSSSVVAGIKLEWLSPTSGYIVSKLTRRLISQGEEVTTVVYVSSIWVQRAGQLVCIFRQETAAAQ
jgi:hypothetical protein